MFHLINAYERKKKQNEPEYVYVGVCGVDVCLFKWTTRSVEEWKNKVYDDWKIMPMTTKTTTSRLEPERDNNNNQTHQQKDN